MKYHIFILSVQDEFAAERRGLNAKNFTDAARAINGDVVLCTRHAVDSAATTMRAGDRSS